MLGSGNQREVLSCGSYLMSITKRALIVKKEWAFTAPAEEKPPATVRRRLSGETVGIDLWL